ncbi:hypothetical protein VTN00DRAFT_4102 [Thermoascus crustaceus]|uniref:uncharacterized protein n=1 Tax=Thermoascus crustaceus TaxID=5088 RepID=UPI003743488D
MSRQSSGTTNPPPPRNPPYSTRFSCPQPKDYPSFQVLEEAHTIDFVSKNTTVPVPKIITAFHRSQKKKKKKKKKNGTCCYLPMKRCPGVPLDSVICTLPAAEQKVLQELRGYLDQLRALEPPRPGGKKVSSTDYGPLEDFHLSRGGEPCGPFEKVVEFHKASRDGVEYPTGNAELDNLILAQESRDYSIKFTHGYLAWRHIFYADGKITGIIDYVPGPLADPPAFSPQVAPIQHL